MIQLQPYFPRLIGFDWGYIHSAVTLWGATDSENYYIYREWVTSNLTAPEIAAGIIERTPCARVVGGFDERKMVKAMYCGTDIFARKTTDRTIAIEMDSVLAPHGFGFSGVSPAATGPGDRVLGWNFLAQLFKQDRIKISPACRTLLKAIPAAIRAYPDKPEDLKKVEGDGDDALDALRYLCFSSSLQPRVPLEVAALRLVTAPLSNLTARAVQYKDAMADLRRGRRGIRFGR